MRVTVLFIPFVIILIEGIVTAETAVFLIVCIINSLLIYGIVNASQKISNSITYRTQLFVHNSSVYRSI